MSHNFHMEVNFQEAVKEAYRAYSIKTLSEEAIEIVQAHRDTVDPLTPTSKSFE